MLNERQQLLENGPQQLSYSQAPGTPLESNPGIKPAKKNSEKKAKNDAKNIFTDLIIRTSSFGFRSLIVAIHYVGNGFIMSSLGTTEAAASSITTTIQSFTIGASSGFLVNTGFEIGEALGNKDQKAVSDTIKTGWSICVILGGLSSLAFLSTKYTLPLILEDDVAVAAADFFQTFAIAAIPDLLIWTNGQIVFQVEKNSVFPVLCTAVYRGSALILSYYLGKTLNYGPGELASELELQDGQV